MSDIKTEVKVDFGKRKKKDRKEKKHGIDGTIEFGKKKEKRLEREKNVKAEAQAEYLKKFMKDPNLEEEPDYTYEELIKRIYGIIEKNNPDLKGSSKLILKPPKVWSLGTRRTGVANLDECAKQLNRDRGHLESFIRAELGTTADICGHEGNCLVIKGRFKGNHIENLLIKYVGEFVKCRSCGRMNTVLNKEERLQYIECLTCRSRAYINAIEKGFRAATTKRAAIRSKQG
ncbi:hypothetical protein SNEBB_006525 [Seison nebaliae]|nr:hypothetical protein SNEBB_006525 [Seison nebaliae]